MRIQQKEVKQLFLSIKSIIDNSKQQIVTQVNNTIVYTYYAIGKMIIEREQKGNWRAAYGQAVIQSLSVSLTKEFGKGFSERNLELMRKFYLNYTIPQTLSAKSANAKKQKAQTLSAKSSNTAFALSWSHYVFLLQVDEKKERKFYEIESAANNWSLRELKRQFNSGYYQRLLVGKNKAKAKELAKRGQRIESPLDMLKDPFVLEFLGLKEEYDYTESEIEQGIINQLGAFLLEMGKGFMFVARQQRLSFDEKHFYVDLVFYNRFLKSFVLIDLKIGELTHADLGQMQMYVNYYDRTIKVKDEHSTIGIILCRHKTDTLVEFTLPKNNSQVFARNYKLVMPTKKQLQNILKNYD